MKQLVGAWLIVLVTLCGCEQSQKVRRLKANNAALQKQKTALEKELGSARAALQRRVEQLAAAQLELQGCQFREKLICGLKLTLTVAGRAPDPAAARRSLEENTYWDAVNLRFRDGSSYRFANRDGSLAAEEFKEGVFFIKIAYFPASPFDFIGREIGFLSDARGLEISLADLFSQADLVPVREVGLDKLELEVNSRQVLLLRWMKPVAGNLDEGNSTFDLAEVFSGIEDAYRRAVSERVGDAG